MKYLKYLVFIPLTIWIFLFVVISGLLSYYTNINQFWLISLLSLYSIFALVWWTLIMNSNKPMSIATKIIYLAILNFPAYFMIKKVLKNSNDSEIYFKDYTLVDYEMMPDWEKEKINQKKEKQKEKNNISDSQKIINEKRDFQYLIINEYVKFLQLQILKKHSNLTNTYKINQLMKDDLFNQKQNKEMINFFIKNNYNWIENESKNLNKFKINTFDFLNSLDPSELFVIYKQNRVDITIENQIKLENE